VGSVRRVVVASPAYLRRHGVPRHPRELLRANCVSAGRPWLFQEAGRDLSMQLSGNLEFNIGAPAIEACAEGVGLGMFLSYQVAPLVAQGHLRIVLEAFERPPMPLSIVYPQARQLPRRTRLFIDWMKLELAAVA
jgi:DNA-binding transcriptional LysR family regulator